LQEEASDGTIFLLITMEDFIKEKKKVNVKKSALFLYENLYIVSKK